ncbi:alpha/beta fold hydrolase [Aurantimonas sp. C2-6-R+9]|nr:alpha/beta fold hydrolase [Aurantimonas sp. C2-6-R+9]
MNQTSNSMQSAGRTSEHIIKIGGASVHFREWGSGSPVLLLHGNPDSSVMWDRVASALATDFRCIAPDLPGFGLSEIPENYERSLAGLAEFIETSDRLPEYRHPSIWSLTTSVGLSL